ncbi:MAG: hypothetical protein ABII26_11460 [Pseudomonadota bacterium]
MITKARRHEIESEERGFSRFDMEGIEGHNRKILKRPVFLIFLFFVLIGLGGFIFQLAGNHPERAWQTYLINFLIWSAMAQGGLLFSVVTHLTKARWSRPLQGLSESFAAFFPFSLVLFLLLFIGKEHLFPWLHQDLHGKEAWLNLPFLFSRDFLGLFILYGLGLAYLYYSLRLKLGQVDAPGKTRGLLRRGWLRGGQDPIRDKGRMSVLSVLYILAYAIVLSLLSFDLVMSMDPHWISTLFGAYSFVKAFYMGLGALIILIGLVYLRQGEHSGIASSHFHDLGKLFFGFCLIWADFFYCQFIVIWYGNISEETSYIIERTMLSPWRSLAWTVFALTFIIPFFVLINKKVKTKPVLMMLICTVALVGLWLEHLLLLGPALNHEVSSLPLGISDGLITVGFLGLMTLAITLFLDIFPELVPFKDAEVS